MPSTKRIVREIEGALRALQQHGREKALLLAAAEKQAADATIASAFGRAAPEGAR